MANVALVVVGIVVLASGIFCLGYQENSTSSSWWGFYTDTQTVKPYEAAAIPLLVGGGVLTIVGLAINGKQTS